MYYDSDDPVLGILSDLSNLIVKVTPEIRGSQFWVVTDQNPMSLQIVPYPLNHLICFLFYHDRHLVIAHSRL